MKLKNILVAGLGLLLGSTFSNAQGLQGVIVEKYYVSNAADAANANAALSGAGYTTGTLPAGSVTWRIYADLAPGWGVQSVYGITGNPVVLSTTTQFFNHPNGLVGPFSSSGVLTQGTTILDSYVACGGVTNTNRFGVVKTEDAVAGGANLTFGAGILTNNDPSAAPALSTADGVYNTAGAPALLGVTRLGDITAPAAELFSDGGTVGNSFNSTNSSWGVLGEQVGAFPTGTNRVLIGQFTTDGVFTYALNLQIRNTTNFAVENYVNSNATGGAVLFPSLAGVVNQANQPPLVNITAPANGSSFFVGDNVTINATASDPDGSVTQVEFFVNGVSVGVDNTAPYSANYVATSGVKNITAVATDNGGQTATSSVVTITVGTNTPPTVSITAPTAGSIFTAPAAVNIDATAADPGGSVANVEFFVDGVSVGVDNTSPYSVSWTSGSPFGNRVLTARATDNFGAQTTSAPVTINILDPNALPYTVGNLIEKCTNSTFCLPITASDTVADIIGYDIVLDYDVNKVAPTGAILRSNDLLLPSFNFNMVSTAYSTDAVNGKMRIAVFFNSLAPANARFAGSGDIICVEFAKTAAFASVDTALFSCDTLMESRITGVQLQGIDPGRYITYKDSIFNSNLKFWKDLSPIRYNSVAPGDYLITNIYGNSMTCNNRSTVAVQPDLNGNFAYNINNGPKIEVLKDIASATDVQPVINGFDAFLTRRVLINDASFVPSVYQMIAMDVNTDGVVSAGDLSQINQRAVLFIPEFQQDWNYNAQGVSNGEPSRDWLFVDVTTVSSNPSYYISTTYPSNDGIGYSKNKVPQVDFCSPIPVSFVNGDCPNIGTESYLGILIGDANGNYASNNAAPSPFRVAGTEKVVYDLTKAVVADGFVTVPVSVTSSEIVNAIDFSMQFNSGKLSFEKVTDLTGSMMTLAHFNTADQKLRFTSSSMDAVKKNTAVLNLTFSISGTEVTESDLNGIKSYINGEEAGSELRTGISSSSDVSVSVFPNPANAVINVIAGQNAQLELSDISGRTIMTQNNILAGELFELNVQGIANGVYMLKVWNGEFVKTTKVVVKH